MTDDTTLILDGSENYLLQACKLLDAFAAISGFQNQLRENRNTLGRILAF